MEADNRFLDENASEREPQYSKKGVFMGSKPGRHQTIGTKAVFSRKNASKQQKKLKKAGFSLIGLGPLILIGLGRGVTKRKCSFFLCGVFFGFKWNSTRTT